MRFILKGDFCQIYGAASVQASLRKKVAADKYKSSQGALQLTASHLQFTSN